MDPVSALLRLGETDCEAIGVGFLAQPVNSLSSLGFVAAGAYVIVHGGGADHRARSDRLVVGSALALVGLGSLAFHGPQPPGSRWLHDWSIGALLLLVGSWSVAVSKAWNPRLRLPIYVGAVTGLGITLAVSPAAGKPVLALLAVAAIVPEVARHQSGLVEGRTRHAYAFASVALITAMVVNLLGRTGGPWCEPGSLLQWHAFWHLLTALAAAAVAVPLLEWARSSETPHRGNALVSG